MFACDGLAHAGWLDGAAIFFHGTVTLLPSGL